MRYCWLLWFVCADFYGLFWNWFGVYALFGLIGLFDCVTVTDCLGLCGVDVDVLIVVVCCVAIVCLFYVLIGRLI